MRGKGPVVQHPRPVSGITPAYAGKSVFAYLCSAATEDHPRLCGEKILHSPAVPPLKGSPPPMRGKAEVMRTMTDLNRITPAYAGKRFSRLRSLLRM